MNKTGSELLGVVKRMLAHERLKGRQVDRHWEILLDSFLKRRGDPNDWKRPHWNKDRLDDSPDGLSDRVKHPIDDIRRTKCPRVFLGPIASANVVQSDPIRRDTLRDRFEIRAIEMEGSGVADASWVANIGYLVIRGTCDYCNSAKNDVWHKYAALVAAAFTRSVVENVHPIHDGHLDPSVGTLGQEIASVVRTVAFGSLVGHPPKVAVDANAGEEAAIVRFDDRTTVDLGTDDVDQTDGINRRPSGSSHLKEPDTSVELLVAMLDELVREARFSEARKLASELEQIVTHLPRRGHVIRQAWLLLTKVESQRLDAEHDPGTSYDVTRLSALRKEAMSVTD